MATKKTRAKRRKPRRETFVLPENAIADLERVMRSFCTSTKTEAVKQALRLASRLSVFAEKGYAVYVVPTVSRDEIRVPGAVMFDLPVVVTATLEAAGAAGATCCAGAAGDTVAEEA